MFKKILTFGLVAFGFAATTLAPGAQAQEMRTLLPQDSKVTTGKLANGLTYYIRPNQKPANKVELRLVVNTGSMMEDDDQQGLAHFMEHMNFNGLKNFPKNKLVDYLQSIGVTFGADLNAYTSFDETVYILPIPTDKPGNLEKGFQIVEDWAHNSLLTDKDINDERKVVLEESRTGKGAQDRMSRLFLPKLLAGSRYADRLPIGKDEILKTFKPDVIRRYYKNWYRPNLMAVVVVGDITTEKAEAMIKQHFAGIKNPDNERERPIYPIGEYKGEDAMFLTDREQTSTLFLLNFSVKKQEPSKTVGDYKGELVKNLFQTILNDRFRDASSSSTPPFTFAQASLGSYARGYDGFGIVLMPTEGGLKPAIDAAVGEVLSASQYGFNEGELELAKRGYLSGLESAYNERTTTNSSRFVDEYVQNFLTKEPFPGIENEYNLAKVLLPSITLADVNTELKSWFTEKDKTNYFALVMSPEKTDALINSKETLIKEVNDALHQSVQAKAATMVATDILKEMPKAGTIVSVEENKELGAKTYVLSNGVLVTVKPTDFKSDEIMFTAVRKSGSNNYGPADRANINLADDVVEAMGYGDYTPTELTKLLTGTNISLQPSIGDLESKMSGESSVKDLEKLLQLNYLQMTAPRLDEALFKSFISKNKTQLQFIKANPQASFIDTFIKRVYNNSPLRPWAFPSIDDLNAANAARIVEIFKTQFGSASGLHVFMVGNIDEATLKPLLEKYVASLPSDGSIPKSVDNGLRPVSGNNKFVFEKGADPKSLIIANYFGDAPFTEQDALKASLLGQILNIRVIENMREKMGSVYSGQVQAEISRDPYPHYQFTMYLPTGPESVEPLLAAAKEELTNVKKNGPTAKDLEKVKIGVVEQRKEALKTNRYWMGKLESILFNDYSQEQFLDFDKRLNSITTKDIQKSANLYFNDKNTFIAVLNPDPQAMKKKEEKKEDKK